MFCDSEDLPSSVDNITDSVLCECVWDPNAQPKSVLTLGFQLLYFYITTCNLFLWNMDSPGVNTDKVNYQPFQ